MTATSTARPRLGLRAGPAAAARRCAALVLACVGFAAAAGEPHRLTIGDRAIVAVLGLVEPAEATVDLDGMLGVPVAGRVAVAGLTLDAAETAIADRLAAASIAVDPAVTLSIAAYSPLLVTGDVRAPGAIAFHPALTAASAVDLAGGPALAQVDADQFALLQADLDSEALALRAERTRLTLQLERVEAQLAGTGGAAVDLAAGALGAIEARILDDDLAARATRLRLIEAELAELDAQIALLEGRVANQREVVALQTGELEQAERLIERGLRPAGETLRFERLVTEARSRLLEVETVLSQSRLRRGELRREREGLEASRRARLLEAARDLAAALERNAERRDAVARKRLIVGGRTVPPDDSLTLIYMLRRRGEPPRETAGDTSLRPGDALSVRVIAVDPG